MEITTELTSVVELNWNRFPPRDSLLGNSFFSNSRIFPSRNTGTLARYKSLVVATWAYIPMNIRTQILRDTRISNWL